MKQETDGTGRAWAWMVAGGAAGLTALPLMLYWGRLPEPVAVRWSISGAPDGPMPKLALLAFSCSLLVLFAWSASRRPLPAGVDGAQRRTSGVGALAVMAVGGMLMPAMAVLVVALNLDRPDWRHAEPLTPATFWLSFVPSVLALVGVLAARALQQYPRG